MSHKGNGVHGEWRNQGIRSFDRMNQVFGYGRAWQVFIGVDLQALPSEPDIIACERRMARKAYSAAVKSAKSTYGKYGRRLDKALKRGLITIDEYYKHDTDALALCDSRERQARLTYRAAMRGLDQMAVLRG